MRFVKAIGVLLGLPMTLALNNGKAIQPPMGFRTWNQWQGSITQSMMLGIIDALVTPRSNNPTISLAQLGFSDAGLDDGFQQCGSYGPLGCTFHDELGSPVIDPVKFPNLGTMVDYAHSLNLTVSVWV